MIRPLLRGAAPRSLPFARTGTPRRVFLFHGGNLLTRAGGVLVAWRGADLSQIEESL